MIEKLLDAQLYKHWAALPCQQQPQWPDQLHLHNVLDTIRTMPPLVSAQEVLRLRERLAGVVERDEFILQGGDCAERFLDCNTSTIENKVNLMLEMGAIFERETRTDCVLLGRIAGQYAKPRSGSDPLLFRGDNVNGFNEAERKPNPDRLLRGYYTASATLNYIRTILATINEDRTNNNGLGAKSVGGEAGVGAEGDSLQTMRKDAPKRLELHTSHEALLLPYEDALTREIDGKLYNLSAPFIWIGDRTRQVDHAHIHYARHVENPVGIKVGPSMTSEELIDLLRKVWREPESNPGKVTLITRYGVDKVRKFLPHHIRAVQSIGFKVIWSCDPCHGNTFVTPNGFKTRHFNQMLSEVQATMEVHAMEGSRLHGVHLEMTAEDVTECIGGGSEAEEAAEAQMMDNLGAKYETYCDPRLNCAQSLRFAQLLAHGFALATKHMSHNGATLSDSQGVVEGEAAVNPLCSLQ